MDGWMDGWMNGRTDGRTDGRMDGSFCANSNSYKMLYCTKLKNLITGAYYNSYQLSVKPSCAR